MHTPQLECRNSLVFAFRLPILEAYTRKQLKCIHCKTGNFRDMTIVQILGNRRYAYAGIFCEF